MRVNQLNHLITCVYVELRELGIVLDAKGESVIRQAMKDGKPVEIELDRSAGTCTVTILEYEVASHVLFTEGGELLEALQKRFEIALKSKVA